MRLNNKAEHMKVKGTLTVYLSISFYIVNQKPVSYNLRRVQFGCIINTELPSCVDIIRRTSLGFPSRCSESTSP